MSKPVLWVVEVHLFIRSHADEWVPTNSVGITKSDAHRQLRERRSQFPTLKYRLRQYARVEKRRK